MAHFFFLSSIRFARRSFSSVKSARTFPSSTTSRRHQRFLSYEESQSYLKGAGFRRYTELHRWLRSSDRPPFIPSHPERIYADCGWVDYAHWCGYEKRQRKTREFHVDDALRRKRDRPRSVQQQAAQIRDDFIRFIEQRQSDCEFRRLPYNMTVSHIFRKVPKSGAVADLWVPVQILVTSPHKRKPHTHNFRLITRAQVGVIILSDMGKKICARLRHELPLSITYITALGSDFVDREGIFERLEQWWRDAVPPEENACSKPLLLSESDCAQFFVDRSDSLRSAERCSALAELSKDFLNPYGISIRHSGESSAFFSALLEERYKAIIRMGSPIANSTSERLGVKSGHRIERRDGISYSVDDPFDLMVVLVRQPGVAFKTCAVETATDSSTRQPLLAGFFLFPKSFLLSEGVLANPATRCAGMINFYVMPPFANMCRVDARARQDRQRSYYVRRSEDMGCVWRKVVEEIEGFSVP